MAVINVYGLGTMVRLAQQELEPATDFFSGLKRGKQMKRELDFWPKLNTLQYRLRYAITSIRRLNVIPIDLSVYYHEEFEKNTGFETQTITIVVDGLFIPDPGSDKLHKHVAEKLAKEARKLFSKRVVCVVHKIDSESEYAEIK